MARRKTTGAAATGGGASSAVVRLKDIAERAGCSVNTVSRALRGDPLISSGRRAQVAELAQAMGYRPDPLVAALCQRIARRKEGERFQATVALVDPMQPLGGVMVRRLTEAARQRLDERGYGMETFDFRKWQHKGKRLVSMLESRGILGIIFLHFPSHDFELDWDLSRLAGVAFGHTLVNPAFHRVTENHSMAMQLALENVTRLGYRRPGMVLGSHHHKTSAGTWLGRFLAWQFEQRPLDPVPPFIEWNYATAAPDALLAWYDAHRPDVIIGHDWRAIEALKTHRKLRCPEDIAFVSLIQWSGSTQTAGTNINPRACGAALADLLVAQLQRNERGAPPLPRVTMVSPHWMDGPTCPPRLI